MIFLGSPRKTVRMVYSALGTTKNVEKWEKYSGSKKNILMLNIWWLKE